MASDHRIYQHPNYHIVFPICQLTLWPVLGRVNLVSGVVITGLFLDDYEIQMNRAHHPGYSYLYLQTIQIRSFTLTHRPTHFLTASCGVQLILVQV